MRKHRFRNSYVTSAISVSLVLCLIGLEGILLLSADSLITRMRENITITAVLAKDADTTACARLEAVLNEGERCSSYKYVSASEALEEHIRSLGEDPAAFLGFNPLSASYEIHPTNTYSDPDSLALFAVDLEALPYVTEVIYPRDLADLMSSNVHEFSLILLAIALALLLVSMVLIVNTIRLQIYSKRFLINTMTLVGATSWVTRRPFVLRNMMMGFIAGIIALLILGGLVYYVEFRMGLMLCLLITLFASLIATGRYIRMDNNSLYEI